MDAGSTCKSLGLSDDTFLFRPRSRYLCVKKKNNNNFYQFDKVTERNNLYFQNPFHA